MKNYKFLKQSSFSKLNIGVSRFVAAKFTPNHPELDILDFKIYHKVWFKKIEI